MEEKKDHNSKIWELFSAMKGVITALYFLVGLLVVILVNWSWVVPEGELALALPFMNIELHYVDTPTHLHFCSSVYFEATLHDTTLLQGLANPGAESCQYTSEIGIGGNRNRISMYMRTGHAYFWIDGGYSVITGSILLKVVLYLVIIGFLSLSMYFYLKKVIERLEA